MNLPSSVTIQIPAFTRKTGEVRTFSPITLTELDITITDNAKRKRCEARVRPCPVPLILWEKEAYDAIGDYTQAQAEARILELLGDNPKAALEALFVRAVQPTAQT